jgi:hypothetical protein
MEVGIPKKDRNRVLNSDHLSVSTSTHHVKESAVLGSNGGG